MWNVFNEYICINYDGILRFRLIIFSQKYMPNFKNKIFLNVGKIFLASLILWLLVKTSLINFALFANILHQPLHLFAVMGIFLTMVVLCSLRWSMLNKAQNIPLAFRSSIKPTYISAAFNILLPGAVGGDFVRCYYVFKIFPDKKSLVLLTIFFDRVIGFMGILVTLCLVAFTHVTFFSKQHELFYLLSMTVCFCLTVMSVFVALMIFPQRFGVHTWLEKKFPDNKWAQLASHYLSTFCNYRIPKFVLLKTLATSVLIQCLLVCSIMLIANMMGLPSFPFSQYAIATGITLLVSLIPITPGGVGMGEMAFANVLVLLNPHSGVAFATIYLCYRILSLLTYLPAVFFYLPSFNLSRKKELKFKDEEVSVDT